MAQKLPHTRKSKSFLDRLKELPQKYEEWRKKKLLERLLEEKR